MSAKHSNLTLRVLSALVLFPLLVWISWMGGLPFAVLLSIAAGVGALEATAMLTEIGHPEMFGVAVAAFLPIAPWWADTS